MTRMIRNARNAKCNVKYRILQFLETRLSGDEYWSPSMIASKKYGLNLSKGTVRSCLKRLADEGKVVWEPKGSIHLYIASNRVDDDFKCLFNLHGTGTRYQIHGLTLKLESESIGINDFMCGCNGQGVGGTGVVEAGWKGKGAKGTGETSFQLSKNTLMVYCGCSNSPMDYDQFIIWLAKVDGFLVAKGWPRLDGWWRFWKVVQYGFNKDHRVFRNDSPTKSVSIKGFEGWFARVYEKEGRGLRTEIHSQEEKSLEQFVQLASGSMTTVQILQSIPIFMQSVNNSQRIMMDVCKGLGELKRIVYDDHQEVKRLKKEIADQNNFKKRIG